MTISLERICYTRWNQNNKHLKELTPTTLEKVCKVAWDALSVVVFVIGLGRMVGWAVKFFAKGLILPSTWSYSPEIIQNTKKTFKKFCKSLEKNYKVEEHIVKTPDQVGLNVVHFKHHKATKDTPTILLFHSNGSYFQQGIYSWLIREAIQRGVVCNFVAFNYRGVIDSEGVAEEIHHLQIDGDAVYQFVKNQLEVPPSAIHFYGWSLGGAVAANVKSMSAERVGKFANVRSLGSTASVVNERISWVLKPFCFWLPWAVRQQGWDLRAPLEKIEGPLLIAYHRKDETIPLEASAYKAAKRMKIAFKELELIAQEPGLDHHIAPLKLYQADKKPAHQAIADFLFK